MRVESFPEKSRTKHCHIQQDTLQLFADHDPQPILFLTRGGTYQIAWDIVSPHRMIEVRVHALAASIEDERPGRPQYHMRGNLKDPQETFDTALVTEPAALAAPK